MVFSFDHRNADLAFDCPVQYDLVSERIGVAIYRRNDPLRGPVRYYPRLEMWNSGENSGVDSIELKMDGADGYKQRVKVIATASREQRLKENVWVLDLSLEWGPTHISD